MSESVSQDALSLVIPKRLAVTPRHCTGAGTGQLIGEHTDYNDGYVLTGSDRARDAHRGRAAR